MLTGISLSLDTNYTLKGIFPTDSQPMILLPNYMLW